MTSTTDRKPYAVWANYGDRHHILADYDTLGEAVAAMREFVSGYANEGGGTAHFTDDRSAHVDLDGHTIARFTIARLLDDTDAAKVEARVKVAGNRATPSTPTAEREHVAYLIHQLVTECALADVDDYRGEAVNFLDAIMAYAEGRATTPADAVRMAYGIPA